MNQIVVSTLEDESVEFVERKGTGHPDTICDALAETLSRSLCLLYRERFGRILHYNVDKALLCGGRSQPAFGGGRVLAPIRIILAGRVVTRVGRQRVPIRETVIEGSRAWLKANLHALDAERHVRLATSIQPGSADLRALFEDRGERLANDTSIGVGHAPLSALEQLVLAIEKRMNERDREREHPAWGEDVKVNGHPAWRDGLDHRGLRHGGALACQYGRLPGREGGNRRFGRRACPGAWVRELQG